MFLSSFSMELRVPLEPWGHLRMPFELSSMQDSFLVAVWLPLKLRRGLLSNCLEVPHL